MWFGIGCNKKNQTAVWLGSHRLSMKGISCPRGWTCLCTAKPTIANVRMFQIPSKWEVIFEVDIRMATAAFQDAQQ